MKKLLIIIAVIQIVISAITWAYAVIASYNMLMVLTLLLCGITMIVGICAMISIQHSQEIRRLFRKQLLINLAFAIFAIASLLYIYNKDDGEITSCITDKPTLEELGLLVADYQQINKVDIENVSIVSNMYVAYRGKYTRFNSKGKITVNPDQYGFIITMKGDEMAKMFDWRKGLYDFSDTGMPEYTTIKESKDGTLVYTTGHCDLIDSIKVLPDTVAFHIYGRNSKKDIDSLVFVKNRTYKNTSVKPGVESIELSRKRSFVERIKDLYLID